MTPVCYFPNDGKISRYGFFISATAEHAYISGPNGELDVVPIGKIIKFEYTSDQQHQLDCLNKQNKLA